MILAEPRMPTRARWVACLAVIASVAFVLRLLPVLRGGGLFGRGNYDDGVYYSAAVGLTHGLLPYRDFLLLHPPGIVLALAPFAAAGRIIGDPAAFAAARVVFMAVGATSAVLVALIVRRAGWIAVWVGGLSYAAFYPAIYVEHTTLLEPVATVLLLAAIGLCTTTRNGRSRHVLVIFASSGLLLGFAAGVKIWGVLPAAVVIIWIAAARGLRPGIAALAGFAAGVIVVCLPFYLAAPTQMWDLVVSAQLGRGRTGGTPSARLTDLLGLSPLEPLAGWVLPVAVGCLVGSAVLACWTAVGRLAVATLAVMTALLLITPSWFLHYAAAIAGPLCLVLGSAAGVISRWYGSRLRRARSAPHDRPVMRTIPAGLVTGAAGLIAVGLIMLGWAGSTGVPARFGQPIAVATLRTASAASPSGCVTTDDPITLIELDLLRSNLHRGCPLVVDLGGYSYYLQPGDSTFVARKANVAWQRLALSYLGSGDRILLIRFSRRFGFSSATAKEIDRWPLLARVDGVTVRSPLSGHRTPPFVASPQVWSGSSR